jgi:hypothetical protein
MRPRLIVLTDLSNEPDDEESPCGLSERLKDFWQKDERTRGRVLKSFRPRVKLLVTHV